MQTAIEANDISASTFGAMVSRFDGTAGAVAYLLLILLYIPCVAALGAINREIGARWTAFASCWTMGIAYGVSVSFYQAATFTRHRLSSSAWIGGILLVLLITIMSMRFINNRSPQLPSALKVV